MGTTDSSGEASPELVQLRHDLKQYVAAGILLTEQPTRGTPLDPEVRQRLDRIHQVFLRMDELTRPTEVPSAPDFVVDLVQLVDECVSYVRMTHGVPLDVSFDERIEAVADPSMLRRAVINVLDNATRAAGDTGTVRVHVHALPGEALVEVADDGDGFGRIPSVSGHGMSIVDEALRRCRGRLEISSGPGPGTTVRMRIPVQVRREEVS